jgi:cyclic pyranopterin phosphate synthase
MVGIFVKAGIKNVRITGGEPLIKKDLVELVKMLKSIDGLKELSMTTNGVNLNSYAEALKDAGLDRINISLDTLKRERFRQITGSDNLAEVLKGIDKVSKLGFAPVKLNMIPMQGINDDEILDFVNFSKENNLYVRFIEFFPTNTRSQEMRGLTITNKEVKQKIEDKFGELSPINVGIVEECATSRHSDFEEQTGLCHSERSPKGEAKNLIQGNGPAKYYRLNNSLIPIGFISSYTENFCNSCNRIRVNCAGRISPCLFSGYRYDIQPLLRNNASEEEMLLYVKKAISEKPCFKKTTFGAPKIEMSTLGG